MGSRSTPPHSPNVVDSGSGQRIELIYAPVPGTALTRLQRIDTYWIDERYGHLPPEACY